MPDGTAYQIAVPYAVIRSFRGEFEALLRAPQFHRHLPCRTFGSGPIGTLDPCCSRQQEADQEAGGKDPPRGIVLARAMYGGKTQMPVALPELHLTCFQCLQTVSGTAVAEQTQRLLVAPGIEGVLVEDAGARLPLFA